MNKQNDIDSLIAFLDRSPTAWHAVENLREELRKAHFQELHEGDSWKLTPGGRYYLTRNGSTLCAFVMPTGSPKSLRLLGSHTDSPAFKLKPQAEFLKENMLMLGVEIYGGPLLTSWLNRDLGIAGRVVLRDKKGHLRTELVTLDQNPVVIPQLAIHLDRTVNEDGLKLQKQEHLAALAALDIEADKKSGKTHYLETLLKEQYSFEEWVSGELFLYPLEGARLMGYQKQMISSYRLDNLASVFASAQALLGIKKPSKDQLQMAFFWDNEEVGSGTAQGAHSPFLMQTLERICLASKIEREGFLRLLSQGICLSVDLAHALHPNYNDKHEPRHPTLMNKGIVLKTNAQQRYASDAVTTGLIAGLCKERKIPFQYFIPRNDIPSGSTIGPINAQVTGMTTLDLGCVELSMHSARELAAVEDLMNLTKLLGAFLGG